MTEILETRESKVIMAKKTVIKIDEEKCIGCCKCANACPGGALAMVNGKAKLVREDFCDGMGVCIGKCPVDAIEFIEVDVSTPEANPSLAQPKTIPAGGCPSAQNMALKNSHPGSGCPSQQAKKFDRSADGGSEDFDPENTSELGAWPIQLHLIRPEAPQFQNADILIAASCSAFSYGSFHKDFLAGKGLVIACPKLDKQEGYLEKLTQFFEMANPKSVTIARMEVPCCSGLTATVKQAREIAQSSQEVKEVIISLDGSIRQVNII